jgi:hypothetical protein
MNDRNEDERTDTAITTTSGFAIETRRNAENAAITMAAKARANIEAACIMAERHPRSWLTVRTQMLGECKRPGFCESARYKLPRQKFNPKTGQYEDANITGFSIRFAEAALRYMTNMSAGSEVVYEDDEKQIILVTVRDFESNTAIESSVNIPKRIEKKKLRKGDSPISSRTNSSGQTVFLVAATDDEIAMKANSLVSKAMRNSILRMLPGDIADECEEMIERTKANKHAEDPMAAIKKVTDAFASQLVMPDQLERYLGHDLATISPKELDDLRGVCVAIKDGDITWAEALDAKIGVVEDGDSAAADRQAAVEASIEKVKARQAEKKREADARRDAAKQAQQQAPATTEPPKSEPKQAKPPMREPGDDVE